MAKAFKTFLIINLVLLLVALTIATIFLVMIKKEIAGISVDKNKLLYQTAQAYVYDISDNEINKSSIKGNKVVKLSDINQSTIDAFVSIEDKNFYKHNGINIKRMIKAIYNNIKSRRIVEGASTITQQLVKNTHLTNEKTIKRKIQEIFLAKKLEATYTKDEIMELYLNVIYFGNGCYGIEDAANRYFGVSASNLTIDQSALLAAIIKSPKTYDPINNYDKAITRRNLVLKEMQKNGKISMEEYNKYCSTDTNIILDNKVDNPNDLYIKATINEACKLLNTTEQNIVMNGYKIYTYLDVNKQTDLHRTINDSAYYEKNKCGNTADGLAIIINNKTGGVEAFAQNSKYNLCNIPRQPGSAIKPILVYAPALDKGIINPMTQILDESIDIDGYTPHNVGGDNHGYVSVTDSVAKSLNIPAVKTMQYVGIDNCKSFAKNAGVKFSDKDNGYAIALGGFTDGLTLKELTTTYLPFARLGNYVQTGYIRKITTSSGITIYEKDEAGTEIMGSDTAYMMTDMLREGVNSGTSKRLNTLSFDVAGKTGTVAVKGTNYNTDAISIAYTSEHTIGVTLFDYSNSSEYYLEGSNNGGTYCTSIIKTTMQNLYNDANPADFAIPDTVTKLSIDSTELNENHIVSLSTDNTPPKYIINGYFSNRYLPTNTSTKFDEPSVTFNVQNIDNKAIISAHMEEYLSYELYRNNELIDSVQDKCGEYIFEDNNLQPNNMYGYHFRVINNYSNTSNDSDIKTIITKDKYQQIIENELITKGISWYFG